MGNNQLKHERYQAELSGDEGLMRAVEFESPGNPDVLFVRKVPIPIVGDDEILIKVVAVGVSREDIRYRNGDYPPVPKGTYLGFECSGIVVAIGSHVLSFKIGDKVCAVLRYGGGYAEFVAVYAEFAAVIPSGISLVDAAALPQAMCLTIYCLDALRKLSSDKTILIHGAAGGVGVIALQFAKHVGCHVFAVAGKPCKLQTCKMLGANVCINRTKEDFSKVVKDKTKGNGVDIILDVNGKEFFHKNLDCLAVGGSLIIIGLKSGRKVDLNISVLRKKAISIVGANLRNLPYGEVSDLVHKAQEKFWPLIKDGHMKAVVGEYFTLSAAPDAHRAAERCDAAGRVLLVVEKS